MADRVVPMIHVPDVRDRIVGIDCISDRCLDAAGRRSGSEIKHYVNFGRALRGCFTRQRARLYLKMGLELEPGAPM